MSKAAVFAAKQEQIQGFKWGEGGPTGGKGGGSNDFLRAFCK